MFMTEKVLIPRLYLDIDGVIIVDESPFEMVQLNAIEKYSPEVVARLGRTGLELVWLSTWGREASYLSESIDPLSKARILPIQPHINGSMAGKAASIIEEQSAAPAPFVWADDMITENLSKELSQAVASPHLMVRPNKAVGLTNKHLLLIEEFAKEHRAK
jgi:hypothetical protein